MSAFMRLSMGVAFGAPRERTRQPAQEPTPSGFFLSFGSAFAPTSERISSEAPQRRFSIGIAMPSRESGSSPDDYWSAPWRRPYAPDAVRARLQGPKVIWSKRVGM